MSDSPTGTVYRSTGSHYRVCLGDGTIVDAVLRGKIRLQGLKSTNPVAVGDHVKMRNEKGEWMIDDVLPRRNYIPRRAVAKSSRVHILCTNVDQALILFTIEDPVTTLGYVDRLIVTCEAFDVEPILVFNKTDLLHSPDSLAKLEDYTSLYASLGYRVVKMSTLDPSCRDMVRELLRDKISFVAGRSGAGKTSLVNLAEPGLNLKTGSVSDFSGRGKHTTTFAEMHPLSFGGAIIDIPGFKEMEIWDIEKEGLCHCFPEMVRVLENCRFANCLHVHEPGCAVRAAVESGQIAASRYHTYLGMLEDIGRNDAEEFQD